MSGMSASVTSDTTRWRRAVTGSVRKSMVVTTLLLRPEVLPPAASLTAHMITQTRASPRLENRTPDDRGREVNRSQGRAHRPASRANLHVRDVPEPLSVLGRSH